MSEIAPGRIRNIRDYVVPNKKIVCKVIRIDQSNNVHLSLRRVSKKDKEEVLERFEKEKDSLNIIRAVLKEKATEVAERIKKESSLVDFLQSCKDSPENLKKYFAKEDAEKICKILQERKDRQVEIKKEFSLTSDAPDGIVKIKNILGKRPEIAYLAAGRFSIKIKASDYKKANAEMQNITQEIEKTAKKEKLMFSVKEK